MFPPQHHKNSNAENLTVVFVGAYYLTLPIQLNSINAGFRNGMNLANFI